jgi:hypothetical protein
MKITNKLNLPETLKRFIDPEPHNKPGEFSATTLLKGNKEILLTQRHFDEIEIDIADMIFAIFGSAVHYLLEHEEPETFVEEKVTNSVMGYTITGKMDLYNMATGHIDDYKTAAIWKFIYKDFEDWKKQGLIYGWLLRKNGLPAESVRFIGFLKDHSKRKARYDAGYPQKPVELYEFNITDSDIDEIENYICEKVYSLHADQGKLDDEIEPCTAKERWQKPSKWALMKDGNKKAIKLYDSQDEAESAMAEKGNNYYVQERPEENIKCLDYCACKHFCNFYKGLVNEK